MKKSTILTIITLLTILLTIISFFIIKPLITGKSIQEETENIHTYTKAICNKTNYCQDNIITCQGNQTIEITPITGAAVQFHPDNFKDPRDKETIEKLC